MKRSNQRLARTRRMLDVQRTVETSAVQMANELQHEMQELADREQALLQIISDPTSAAGALAPLISRQLWSLSRQQELLRRSVDMQRKEAAAEQQRTAEFEKRHRLQANVEQRATEEIAAEESLEAVLTRKNTSLPQA